MNPTLPRLNLCGLHASHAEMSGRELSGNSIGTVLPHASTGTPRYSCDMAAPSFGKLCQLQSASVLNGTNVCSPVISMPNAKCPFPTCAGLKESVAQIVTLCLSTTFRRSIGEAHDTRKMKVIAIAAFMDGSFHLY